MLFIDESGKVPLPERMKHDFYVIGGVIIPDSKWMQVAKKLKRIMDSYKVRGEVKWRWFSPNDRSKDSSLSHLDIDQKNALRDEIFHIISADRSIKVIAAASFAPEAYKKEDINTTDDLYLYTYKPVTERFQYYLQDTQRETGHPTYGIIICDHRNPHEDKRLLRMHQKLLNGQFNYSSSYKNLVEGLFVAPSHYSVGIQLADMVAGAIYRKVARQDESHFTKIQNSIRNKEGHYLGYGLVIQP